MRPRTISNWSNVGRLDPVGQSPGGMKLYRPGDVRAAAGVTTAKELEGVQVVRLATDNVAPPAPPPTRLLTYSQAAEVAHAAVVTIQRWVKKGWLQPADTTPTGGHLFARIDVKEVRDRCPECGCRCCAGAGVGGAEGKEDVDAEQAFVPLAEAASEWSLLR